ncbi:MAG: hypothetical protein WDM92_08275 [Caulobacteraceae bacterium]
MRQNKPGGVMCVSCAWTRPADHHPFEFCENGAKATLWELTHRRCNPGLLRRAHGQRAEGLERLRPGAAGPADRSAALRPGERQVRPLRMGRGVRGHRRGAEGARSEVDGVLRLGPGPAWRRPTSTPCSPGSTGTTTCPTAPTCATRPHLWP